METLGLGGVEGLISTLTGKDEGKCDKTLTGAKMSQVEVKPAVCCFFFNH